MRKIAIAFLSQLLIFSLVLGANNDQAVKRVERGRMLKAAFSNVEKTQKIPTTEKAVQVAKIRAQKQRARLGKMYRGKTEAKVNRVNENIQFETSFLKGISPALQVSDGMPDTILVDFTPPPDTISYVPGDIIVIRIESSDTVDIEFYVDDGDGIFDPNADFYFDFEEDEEGIWVVDGGEDDETPAGDGVWQKTFDPVMMEENSLFGLFFIQGATLFIVATERNYENEEVTVAFIDRPDSETGISGKIMIEGEQMTPAANMIVVAFNAYDMSMGENGSGGPSEAVGITMTNDSGFYKIKIPDEMRGEYIVMPFDFLNLYPGYFLEPPEMWVPIYGPIERIDFVLRGGTASIAGSVKDENGVGQSGIRVYAESGQNFVETTTGTGGTYELSVSPGWWGVWLEQDDLIPGYMVPQDQWVDVYPDTPNPVDFVVYSTGGTIEGNVSYQDGPAEGIEVDASIWVGEENGGHWTYTETDANGDYTLHVSLDLQNIVWGDDSNGGWTSSYWVGIWEDDVLPVPSEYPDVRANATDIDFTLIESDVTLSGNIYDMDNNPLRDAQVYAYTVDPIGDLPPMDVWGWSDDNGSYELQLLGGTIDDSVTYFIEVFWPYEWPASAFDELENVLSGNDYVRDYYIEPPVKEGYIEGYVYNEDGYGIDGARVEFYGPEYYEVWTGQDGYYRIDGMMFGRYSATAWVEDYPPCDLWDIYVGPEGAYIDFWMGSAAGNILVNGVVTDAATGDSIPNAIVSAFGVELWEPFYFMTDSTGYYEFKLKSGGYEFKVGANGFNAVKLGVDVKNDTTINYGLTAADVTDYASGKVIDDMGNPLKRVFSFWESDAYIGFSYTDFEGLYELGLLPGEYEVVFNKKGFSSEFRHVNFPSQQVEDPLTMWPETHVTGPELITVIDVPEDHGKQVRLTWKRAEGLEGAVRNYQIWRAIEQAPGSDPGGNYTPRWDYVASVPVHPEMDEYHYVAPTLYDKVGDNTYWTAFIVTGIGHDGWSFWDSNIKAGFSEDNLPPEIPAGLVAATVEGDVALSWEKSVDGVDGKVKYYTVYRRQDGASSVVGHTTTPEFEESIEQGTYYYSVTATDFGLNESEKSAEVEAEYEIVGIGDAEKLPEEFALSPNYPNPFNPETTIEYALPKESKVTLTIYNLTGQFVRELVKSDMNAGYYRVIWDARDQYGNAVGSGVYIYTIKADNFTKTQKMILLR